MTTTEQAARRLCLRAADYIEAHGWTRGQMVAHGRVCILGAVTACSFTEDEGTIAHADRLLATAVGHPQLGDWNDAQRSRRPVLALLREVGRG